MSCSYMCNSTILNFEVIERMLQVETERYWIMEATTQLFFIQKQYSFVRYYMNNDVII